MQGQLAYSQALLNNPTYSQQHTAFSKQINSYFNYQKEKKEEKPAIADEMKFQVSSKASEIYILKFCFTINS